MFCNQMQLCTKATIVVFSLLLYSVPQIEAGISSQNEATSPKSQFTNEIVIHCKGGLKEAYQIANSHDLIFISEVLAEHYLFQVPRRHRRNLDDQSTPDLHEELKSNSKVLWFEQQYTLSRQKRDEDHFWDEIDQELEFSANTKKKRGLVDDKAGKLANRTSTHFANVAIILNRGEQVDVFKEPNDPSWNAQWYLHRSLTERASEQKADMNVIEAWLLGFTGKGVVVSIIDDGIEGKHADLKDNFDPAASYDVNDGDTDATPRYDRTNINKHGTRCAGEVAAAKDNNKCVVGVAYNAKVGGVRMLDGQITDSVEARSLSFNPSHIDIYSSSWGPDDDGKTVDGPKSLALKAFQDGIMNGRGGKGSIFVWAAGNGGRHADDCNCDGYTTSIYTVSIASTTERELFPWYSERCSSTLASTYSSGSASEKSIVTTDLRNECTDKHTGTSASAPLAAGICALALEANPELTWRDMQHIVLRSARAPIGMEPKAPGDQWRKNGVRRWVSHSYGYGLMDAGQMVRLAAQWRPVPSQTKCTHESDPKLHKKVEAHSSESVVVSSSGCGGNVLFLEHVVAIISLSIPTDRGKLSIQLTSPMGTTSQLLFPRYRDNSREGFVNWQFMSVHHWEEAAVGDWTFAIKNEHPSATATLTKLELQLYGTLEDPKQFTTAPSNATSLRRVNQQYQQFSEATYRLSHSSHLVPPTLLSRPATVPSAALAFLLLFALFSYS